MQYIFRREFYTLVQLCRPFPECQYHSEEYTENRSSDYGKFHPQKPCRDGYDEAKKYPKESLFFKKLDVYKRQGIGKREAILPQLMKQGPSCCAYLKRLEEI